MSDAAADAVSGSTGPLDIAAVMAALPHRYPMLLVDRVEEIVRDRSIRAIKAVTINEGFFQGHFPGRPIMPGVLIVEALAQAAGLLISASVEHPERLLPYLVGIDGVKFRRPVVPGDSLRLDVELLHRRGRFWKFKGTASVEGERAADAEILLAVLERGEEGR